MADEDVEVQEEEALTDVPNKRFGIAEREKPEYVTREEFLQAKEDRQPYVDRVSEKQAEVADLERQLRVARHQLSQLEKEIPELPTVNPVDEMKRWQKQFCSRPAMSGRPFVTRDPTPARPPE